MTSIDLNSASLTSSQIRDNYFDQNSLNSVKLMGKHNDPQAMKEVAKKFEAMFMQQVMKSMREANEVFSEGNPFSSNEEKFHQDMMDQQLVLNLTSGEGMGLAKALYAQLMKNYKPEQKEKPVDAFVPTAPQLLIQPAFKAAQEKVANSYKAAQKKSVAQDPESFIEKIKPFAERAAKALNVGVDVILAQTALETGWGKHVLHDAEGKNTFNLFNIKTSSNWGGEKVAANTLEVIGGSAVKQKAEFKQYENYEQSFDDYVNLLKSSARYAGAVSATSAEEFANKLQQGGYATDPAYAKKIMQVLSSDLIKSAARNEVESSQYETRTEGDGGVTS